MKIVVYSCLFVLLLCQMCCGRKTSSLQFGDESTSSEVLCPNNQSLPFYCKVNDLYVTCTPGYCAAYNASKKQLICGRCPYVFPQQMIHSNCLQLPANCAHLNASLCGSLSRSLGPIFCGRCQNGTGPAIYSVGSQCTECHLLHILWYILLQYLPMTLLFTVLFTLRVNITSAPTVFYILYCTVCIYTVKTNPGYYIERTYSRPMWRTLAEIQLTLCGIWSLDFFRFVAPPLCVSEHLTEMHVLLLEVLETLYPIILIMLAAVLIKLYRRGCKLVHTLWTPFHRLSVYLGRAWNPDGAVIHACATFFFLSYTKVLAISLLMAEETSVYNYNGHTAQHVVYADPTMIFNSAAHAPYLALSVILVVLFVLPPTLLLTLYPTRLFQMCLCNKPNCKSTLKSFVDTFYSSYRDGTDGGWDCRPLSGVILLIILVSHVFRVNRIHYVYTSYTECLLFVFSLVVIAVLRPYKKWTVNAIAIVALGLFATMGDNSIFILTNSPTQLINFLPQIIFLACIAYKICKFFVNILKKCS